MTVAASTWRGVAMSTLKSLARNPDPPGAAAMLAQMPTAIDSASVRVWRGRVDALALRARFGDADLFAAQSPQGAAARLFADLEQCRVEALGCRIFPGMRENLAALHQSEPPTADSVSAALLTIARRVFSISTVALSEAEFITVAGRVAALAHLLENRAEFGAQARLLASELAAIAPLATRAAEPDTCTEAGGERRATPGTSPAQASQPGILDRIGAEPRGRLVPETHPAAPDDEPYHPFTRAFDAVVPAASLVDRETARSLTERLNEFQRGQGLRTARWAARLQRQLLARQQRAWEFDCDEGLLDSARLPLIVADPMQRLSFKRERPVPFASTAFTLLLDNSGSMRGAPIATAATCALILGAVLERCGVATEVLGYTTRRWRGGRARESWIAVDCPANPGRLTELLHVVYKPFTAPWARARHDIAVMLDPALLKENVDGEALQWAHGRLMRRTEARRILMVISDGAPLDGATLAANDPGYLDRHLRQVIAEIHARSPVELLAIGVGHDVGPWFPNAFTVSEQDALGESIVKQLLALLERSSGS
ncbi:MAG: cobaltochelatase subunit CobT [Pseudomonadota bacterium]